MLRLFRETTLGSSRYRIAKSQSQKLKTHLLTKIIDILQQQQLKSLHQDGKISLPTVNLHTVTLQAVLSKVKAAKMFSQKTGSPYPLSTPTLSQQGCKSQTDMMCDSALTARTETKACFTTTCESSKAPAASRNCCLLSLKIEVSFTRSTTRLTRFRRSRTTTSSSKT